MRRPKALAVGLVAPPGKEPVGTLSAPERTVTASALALAAKVALREPGGLTEVASWMSYWENVMVEAGYAPAPSALARRVSATIRLPGGMAVRAGPPTTIW